MEIKGWRYYNHAAVPTTPPNEEPDLRPIEDNTIWQIGGGTPLLARWTTDFDCGYETNWWHVIKYAPFDEDALSSKVKKHIRQALKKNRVEKIDPTQYVDQLAEVYNNACRSYKGYSGPYYTEGMFDNKKNDDYWAAFHAETGKIIGYMICRGKGECMETVVSKYDPQFLNQRASDAIHYTVLQYYLNEKGYKYINSGARSIEHATQVQDYKINTFGFKKAYCNLHIKYNPKIAWLIKCLYPFRRVLAKLHKVPGVSKINAVLKMEEFTR